MNLTEFYEKELYADILLLDRKRKLIIPASILLRGMFVFFFLFIWGILTAILIRLKPDNSSDLFVPIFRIFLTILFSGIFTIISIFSAKQLIKKYPKRLSTKLNKLLIGFGIFFLLIGLDLFCAFFISLRVTNFNDLPLLKILSFLFGFGFGGGILLYNLFKIENKFKFDFKKLIITKIIEFKFPGSRYAPEKAISEVIFYESKLFSRYPYMRYKGSDFASIIKNGVEIEFSYLDVSTQPTNYNAGTSRSNNNGRTIFDGLFIKMTNNKTSPGEVRIYNYSKALIAAEKIGATILGVFGLNSTKLIKTGNADFDKMFLVYTNTPDTWFTSLTNDKMNILMGIYERTKIKFSLSFVNGIVFLAVSQPGNVFDPLIFSSIIGVEKIQKYINSLEEIFSYHILAE